MENHEASSFIDAVLHGRVHTPREWEAYAEDFHSRFPAANGLFAQLTTADGSTSYDVLARSVAGSNPTTVLDVGCGEGNFFDALAPLIAESARMVGVDVSSGELDAARRRFAGDTRISFVRARAQHLPFEDESFDAVVSHQLLNFIPSPAEAVSEMVRVLRPGGTLFTAVNRGWSRNEPADATWMGLYDTALAALRALHPQVRLPDVSDPRVYSDHGLRSVLGEEPRLSLESLRIEHIAPGARMSPRRAAEIYDRRYVFEAVRERAQMLGPIEERARELAGDAGELYVEIPFRIAVIRKLEDL
jgi:SAM-dependent methyltransferase